MNLANVYIIFKKQCEQLIQLFRC